MLLSLSRLASIAPSPFLKLCRAPACNSLPSSPPFAPRGRAFSLSESLTEFQ